MRHFCFILLILLTGCSTKSDQPADLSGIGYSNKSVESADGGEFVMFVYHRFGDPRHLSTNINVNDFRRQLEYLKEEGFEVVTLGKALSTRTPKNGKRAVITVDDGYRSFMERGVPVLEEFGFPATLFVNTSTVGADDYLTWGQLDTLQDKGIEIGNHSHSHAYFLDLGPEIYLDSFRNDVLHAQKLFEENLSKTPDLFAYPYGEYNSDMQDVIKELGFMAAAAQHSGVVLKGQDTYSMPRFPVSDSYSDLQSFRDKANARAFHVLLEQPATTVIEGNTAPEWKLMTKEKLARGRIQCFVQGGFCQMDSSGDTLMIRSESPLDSRRTLYTITMPDGEGHWYWRSHLWIKPKSIQASNVN